MTGDVESAYREHLTTNDRELVAGAAGPGPLLAALGRPEVERAVFALDHAPHPEQVASPFLTFAVAVHRVADRLATASYVEEWVGPKRRIPVFAVAPLRELVADPRRRYFLVELLASYTHVVSGSTWTPTRRGWRRRRYSELDPIQLAGLLDAVPPAEQAGVLRRLGDLALFLTGVFPDHTATTPLGRPLAELALLRAAGMDDRAARPEPSNGFQLLELLGARWYRRAHQLAAAPTAALDVAADVAERFTDARRVLNVVTDSYLFPMRDRWFGRPAS